MGESKAFTDKVLPRGEEVFLTEDFQDELRQKWLEKDGLESQFHRSTGD